VCSDVLDPQKLSKKEALVKLNGLLSKSHKAKKIRILIGKGGYGSGPPEIPTLSKKFLTEQKIDWSYARPADGGDAALDCSFE
jgi:hypothetical protein